MQLLLRSAAKTRAAQRPTSASALSKAPPAYTRVLTKLPHVHMSDLPRDFGVRAAAAAAPSGFAVAGVAARPGCVSVAIDLMHIGDTVPADGQAPQPDGQAGSSMLTGHNGSSSDAGAGSGSSGNSPVATDSGGSSEDGADLGFEPEVASHVACWLHGEGLLPAVDTQSGAAVAQHGERGAQAQAQQVAVQVHGRMMDVKVEEGTAESKQDDGCAAPFSFVKTAAASATASAVAAEPLAAVSFGINATPGLAVAAPRDGCLSLDIACHATVHGSGSPDAAKALLQALCLTVRSGGKYLPLLAAEDAGAGTAVPELALPVAFPADADLSPGLSHSVAVKVQGITEASLLTIELASAATSEACASVLVLVAPAAQPRMVHDVQRLLLNAAARVAAAEDDAANAPTAEDASFAGSIADDALGMVEDWVRDMGMIMLLAEAQAPAGTAGAGQQPAASNPEFTQQVGGHLLARPSMRQHVANVAASLLASCCWEGLPSSADYLLQAVCGHLQLCSVQELLAVVAGMRQSAEQAVLGGQELQAALIAWSVGLDADMLQVMQRHLAAAAPEGAAVASYGGELDAATMEALITARESAMEAALAALPGEVVDTVLASCAPSSSMWLASELMKEELFASADVPADAAAPACGTQQVAWTDAPSVSADAVEDESALRGSGSGSMARDASSGADDSSVAALGGTSSDTSSGAPRPLWHLPASSLAALLRLCLHGFEDRATEEAYWTRTAKLNAAGITSYMLLNAVTGVIASIRGFLTDGFGIGLLLVAFLGSTSMQQIWYCMQGKYDARRMLRMSLGCKVMRLSWHIAMSLGAVATPTLMWPVMQMGLDVIMEGGARYHFEPVSGRYRGVYGGCMVHGTSRVVPLATWHGSSHPDETRVTVGTRLHGRQLAVPASV